MSKIRVVSLSPSATAIIETLGLTDWLVGVTLHDTVTNSEGEQVEQVGGWVTPDFDRVDELAPDIVVTTDALQRDVCESLREKGHSVFHTEPTSIEETKTSIVSLGCELGVEHKARVLVSQMNERIGRVTGFVEQYGTDGEQPVVYCEEWGNPPMAGGNWVPEIVECAGGSYPFVEPGERSKHVPFTTVEKADPELIVLHHCGMGRDVPIMTVYDRWGLCSDTIVVDDSLMNQPSPNVVFAIELLASVLWEYDPPAQEWDV